MSDYEASERNRRQNRRLLWIMGGVFAAVVIVLLADGRRGQTPATPPPRPSITADVRLGRTRVEVTNRDAFAWTDATVRLNPGLSGRYDCQVGTLAPGETATVRLDDCTTPGGERFDAARRKPTAVAIKTAQGDRYFQP